jgi:hypothetical protein
MPQYVSKYPARYLDVVGVTASSISARKASTPGSVMAIACRAT